MSAPLAALVVALVLESSAVAEAATTPTSVGFKECMLLVGLAAACTVAVFAAIRRVQWRRHLVPIAVFLILFFVICCCGVAVRADVIGCVPFEASAGVMPVCG